MSKTCDPISAFNARIPEITSRFEFDRPWRVVGKADIEDNDDEADEDIYSGTVITPQGFARLAYHKPTSTICLLVSKTAVNLRGHRNKKTGRIHAEFEGLSKSYIVGARRSTTDKTEFRANVQAMRAALHNYCDRMKENTREKFTLFSGSAIHSDGMSAREIYTNGRIAYALDPCQEQHTIKFFAPKRPQAGRFIPVRLDKENFWERINNSSISKVISSGKSYEEGRHDLALHWQKVSSRIWDEKPPHKGEGALFDAKGKIVAFVNHIEDEKEGLAVTAASSMIGAMISHPLGWAALGLGIGHIALHSFFKGGVDTSKQISIAVKKAKQRSDIDAYPANADVSDYFKIKTPENIAKLCPHIDRNGFQASDFEFLQADQCYLLPDHDIPEDGMRPASLRGHLISAHQRGFSSTCSLPDSSTRVDAFQSGLVRLMHEQDDGKIIVLAGYRPDICVLDGQRLPESYSDRFEEGQFIRVEYDRRHNRFTDSFTQDAISYDALIQEVETKILFNGASGMFQEKEKSLRYVRDTFRAPDADNINPKLYMGGQAPCPPDIRALLKPSGL